MRSILTLKKTYYKEYLENLNLKGLSEEEATKAKKRCNDVAEVRAFVDTLISKEYRHLTVFDITGETRNKQKALEAKEALRAKNLVCKYIWGMSWEELLTTYKTEESIKKYIAINSVLMRRLENGSSVAIYGGKNGPCGRTMLASIILKEAIRMRLFVPGIITQSYDWVDFQTLTESLRDGSIDVPDYRTADWLVVDNICLKEESPKQISFRTNLLDPFFTYRLKNNLSTILVFQYDIRLKKEPLYKTLGTGISNIVNSPNVCRIPLSKRD
jgi:DNA replication protein DnaC